MKGIEHANTGRNLVCAGLCLAALCHAGLAQAVQSVGGDDFNKVGLQWSGTSSAKVGMNLGPAATPYTPTPMNLSGWQKAGNYGFNAQAPSGPTVGTHFTFPMPDGRPAQATYTAGTTKAAMTAGMATLGKRAAAFGLPVLGTFLTLSSMAEWMMNSDILRNGTSLDKPFLIKDTSYEGQCLPPDSGWQAWVASQGGTGRSSVPHVQINPSTCLYGARLTDSGGSYFVGWQERPKKTIEQQTRIPANFDEAKNSFEGGVLPSKVLQDLIDWDRANPPKNGIDPFRIDFDDGKVTVANPNMPPTTDKKTVTTYEPAPTPGNPNAQRRIDTTTTTTTTTEIIPTDNTLTLKPKQTTTTTKKVTEPDGSTSETTESETTEEKDQPKEADLCEKHPDILACAKPELDTPDGEIPRTTKNVTFEEQSIWGGGSCPADKVMTLRSGQQVTVWAWSEYCPFIAGPFKFVLLACAAFGALLIVMPGPQT
jgi:Neisseria meningitidis TspB protein